MLERVANIAQQAATNVSRRQFLRRFDRGAAAIAAGVGGLLALPAVARSGKKPPRVCSSTSGECALVYEGTRCGTNGVCKTANRRDKSAQPFCICHVRGRKD